MNIYFLFAAATILLSIARYGTYFYTIYQSKTKPHAFSWLLWGMVTGIGTLVQFDLEAGPSAYALAFVAITCLLIAALAFFIGERDYTKSDWIALIFCLAAIPVWQVTENPLAALFMIITIDAATYWPTIRKSFHKPDTEPPISYAFAGLRYFLMLFAVSNPTWQNLMYPFFLMTADWGVAIYIVVRRAQLGLPLHEYAQRTTKGLNVEIAP